MALLGGWPGETVPGVVGVLGLVVSRPLRGLRPLVAGVAGEVVVDGVSEA
jgi:hypothetical protein